MNQCLVLFFPLLIFVSFLSMYTPPPSDRQMCSWLKDPLPKLVAHRGSRYVAPENTLLAFKAAETIGADVLEFDVRLTSDNVLVIFHDSHVERTTNGTGRIRDKTLEEMKTLDAAYRFSIFDKSGNVIFPERGKGHQVLTLQEFFKEFPNANINIEIKDDEIIAAEILESQLRTIPGVSERVVIASKFCENIKHLRRVGNLCTAACEDEAVMFATLSAFNLFKFWYSFVQIPLAPVFQIPVESTLRLDSKEFIDGAHAFKQKLHYWVINDERSMRELVARGVDGIITDRIDLAIEVFKSLGIKKNLTQERSKYYPSEEIPVEIHDCDGLLCIVFSFLFNLERWMILSAGFTIVAIYWMRSKNLTSKEKKN